MMGFFLKVSVQNKLEFVLGTFINYCTFLCYEFDSVVDILRETIKPWNILGNVWFLESGRGPDVARPHDSSELWFLPL